MQIPDTTVKTVSAGRDSHSIGTALGRITLIYNIWRTRRRARKVLEALPDRLLADAGIERHQIANVVEKASRTKVWRDAKN